MDWGAPANAFVDRSRTPGQKEMHDWVKGLLDMQAGALGR